ncbi:MAG: histidine kinase, partial [Gemmatimonadales bacterium]
MTAIVPPTDNVRHARVFFGATAAMLAVVLAEGAQFYFQQDRFGRSDPYWLVVAQLLRPWILIGLLVPGIIAVARTTPLSTRPWWSIPTHLISSVLFAIVHLTLLAFTHLITDPPTEYPFRFRVLGLMQNYTFQDILVYWAILGALTALWYHRSVVEREREASLLRLSLGEARLGALRAQLHPHLLFNSLNSVSMLVRRGDS